MRKNSEGDTEHMTLEDELLKIAELGYDTAKAEIINIDENMQVLQQRREYQRGLRDALHEVKRAIGRHKSGEVEVQEK